MTLADRVVASVEAKAARNAHELSMVQQRLLTLTQHAEDLQALLEAARQAQQLQRHGDLHGHRPL